MKARVGKWRKKVVKGAIVNIKGINSDIRSKRKPYGLLGGRA